ncbi:MAG: metalloregulator ArsR/SmtB family transcription factor [Chitinivibrionales bacterium]|nr:metalloregulator ArsR/SmtB family transcription factor [Chitinivibrionales bacterium]
MQTEEENNTLDDFLAIAKALSDPSRVRALLALRRGELCVCQIIALLDLAPSTVSRHMSLLKQAGLVKGRKEERWMHYRLAKPETGTGIIQASLQWVFMATEKDNTIEEDKKRMARILRQSPESLCKTRTKKRKGNQ